MKGFVLLILLVAAQFTSFSQTSTETSKDTNSIVLSTRVAKEVIRDIIRLDSTAAEMSVYKANTLYMWKNLAIKDSIIFNKDSLINVFKVRDSAHNHIVAYKDAQLQVYKGYYSDSEQKYKKEKKSGEIKTVVIGVLALLTIIFGLL
jgi:hypothetical protein